MCLCIYLWFCTLLTAVPWPKSMYRCTAINMSTLDACKCQSGRTHPHICIWKCHLHGQQNYVESLSETWPSARVMHAFVSDIWLNIQNRLFFFFFLRKFPFSKLNSDDKGGRFLPLLIRCQSLDFSCDGSKAHRSLAKTHSNSIQ